MVRFLKYLVVEMSTAHAGVAGQLSWVLSEEECGDCISSVSAWPFQSTRELDEEFSLVAEVPSWSLGKEAAVSE